MNEFLRESRGRKVLKILKSDESVTVELEGGLTLVIYNAWTLTRSAMECAQDLFMLVGQLVTEVSEEPEAISLRLGDMAFRIDLSDKAWVGPEAAVLYDHEVPVVVWN